MNSKITRYPFLKVLEELGQLGEDLTLVGGWVPTVYFEYLWKNQNNPFVTQDVDFALTKDIHWNGVMENLINQKHFKHRHLILGKEQPYQLLFQNIPIDFLADANEAEYIQKKILGKGILLNATTGYQFLLKEKIPVTCDGLNFYIPQPTRYILHKMSVGLDNVLIRVHDIATAYYVWTRSPEQTEIFTEIKKLREDPVYKQLRKKLKTELVKSLITEKICALFREVGIYEEQDDIKLVLEKLL